MGDSWKKGEVSRPSPKAQKTDLPQPPTKVALETVIDQTEAFDPACPLYVKKDLKKFTLRTACQPFPPTEWSPQKATAYARKHGLKKLARVGDLEDLIIDLSLKKTHFNTKDFFEALHYYLKKGKYMPVPQPH